jgi:hypothetical protein
MDKIAYKIRSPDDITIGFIIGQFLIHEKHLTCIIMKIFSEGLLDVKLTNIEFFRSQFDKLNKINNENIKDQVMLS